MDSTHLVVYLVVGFALVFDFANGMNDAANAIATVVTTRVLSPTVAIIFGAVLNFVGAFWSDAVAKTIGTDIADPKLLTTTTFLAAVIAAPIWVFWCTIKGLPISCSHSLMGALIGSVLASAGADALKSGGIIKIVKGVFTSPIAGFFVGMLIITLISWTFRRARPKTVHGIFGKLQIVSAGLMAFAHGTGDAQKAMGIITGTLIAGGMIDSHGGTEFHIPPWVRIACATAMGVGTAVGGWAVIKTLGSRLAHIRPFQGFAAETASAGTILLNTHFGVPISTTHSITGAIMGIGAANGMRTVRWGVGRKIVFAWLCTFPICIGSGWLILHLLHFMGL